MNNMKKMLADQQKINEAVKTIFDTFTTTPYATYVEEVLEAQTQIISLMEIAKNQAAISDPNDEVETSMITQFLLDVRTFLQLLRPLADMTNSSND